MKFKEALSIIEKSEKGYMVSFEKREDGILTSDYFPDKHANEDLITDIDVAWSFAERFAKATNDNYVNIYVIDQDFNPVANYDKEN